MIHYWNTNYISNETLSNRFYFVIHALNIKKILKHAGIADIRFHSLRHTFATRLIAQGADYKIVSELLGHQSVTTTLHLYVHPQISQKRQCVELLVNDERDMK